MLFEEYRKQAARTIRPDLGRGAARQHALYGIAAETGEVCSIYQKYYQGHQVRRAELKEELGDLLWMIAELCTVEGLNMDEIAQGNIDKLKKRYPCGFDVTRSIERGEVDRE